jgi:hypothetical protein
MVMNLSQSFEKARKWMIGVDSVEDAANDIERIGRWRQALDVWGKRTLKLAIGVTAVGLMIRSGPLLLYATLPAWGLYGAVRLAEHLLDRSIRMKYEAAEQLKQKGEDAVSPRQLPAHEPSPKPAKKVTGGFNARASGEPAPANENPAPRQSFWSRIGLG